MNNIKEKSFSSELLVTDFTSDVFFLIEQWMKSNHKQHLPAVVVSYDADTQRANVQLTLTMKVLKDDRSVEYQKRPLLLDVPCHFAGGGNGVLTFPLQAGDEGIILICDRDMSEQLDKGGVRNFSSEEIYSLNSSWFINGLRTLPNSIKEFSNQHTELRSRYSRNQRITLKDDGSIEVYSTQPIHVESTSSVNVKAPDIYLEGTVHIKGDIIHTGNQTSTGKIQSDSGMFSPSYSGLGGSGGSMSIGSISAESSIKINGKEINGHDHNGQVPPF